MPNGQHQNRGQGRQKGARERDQESVLELFGISNYESTPFVPTTNEELRTGRRHIAPEHRSSYGMTADSIEYRDDRFRVEVAKAGTPVKYEREAPGDLLAKDELGKLGMVYEEEGNARTARGRFAVDVTPVLVLGNEIYGFRHRDRARNGMGDTEPLHSLPSQSLQDGIVDDFLIIGRSRTGGSSVMFVPNIFGKNPEDLLKRTRERVLAAKERSLEPLREELLRETTGQADKSVLTKITDKIKALEQVREIRVIGSTDISDEFQKTTSSIETVIDGEQEKISGLLRFDEASNTANIIKPVKLAVEGYDIELYDGSGQGRQVEVVSGPHSSRLPELNRIARALESGDQRVQKQKDGPIDLSEAQLKAIELRAPYAVLPKRFESKASRQ